jgi:hypothetical protein
MKTRRFACLIAVIVALVGSCSFADEAKMSALQTALSSTTISGYVDTSVEWGFNSPTPVQPTPKPVLNPFTRWWIGFRMWFRSHSMSW